MISSCATVEAMETSSPSKNQTVHLAARTQMTPTTGGGYRLLTRVWYQTWTSTPPILFLPPYDPIVRSSCAGSDPFTYLLPPCRTISTPLPPLILPQIVLRSAPPLWILLVASSLVSPPFTTLLPPPPSFLSSSFLPSALGCSCDWGHVLYLLSLSDLSDMICSLLFTLIVL